MAANRVYVLSIHDRSTDRGYLAFDLKDVLKALQDRISQWSWCVQELDAIGDDIDSICRAVEDNRGAGTWLSAEELADLANRISQTIDGKFIAFQKDIDRANLSEDDSNLAFFPDNKMQLAVVAVDSSYFEVYAKDESVVAAINSRFAIVRLQDPAAYFSQ